MNTARASRLEPTRRALIFWTLFQDLAFSGAALLIVNGLPNQTAAGLLLARRRSGLVGLCQAATGWAACVFARQEEFSFHPAERTSGTLGFWWCGRYGLHRGEMPIEPLAVDLSAYAQVTICSPIWVFSLAAPVRSFCRQCRLGVYR